MTRRPPAVSAAMAVLLALVLATTANSASALLAGRLPADGAALVAQASASVAAKDDYADAIAEAKKKEAELQRRLEEIEHSLEDTDEAISEASEKLFALEAKLPEARRQFDEAMRVLDAAILAQQVLAARLEAAESEDAEISAQIEADSARVEELQDGLAELARDSYRMGAESPGLALVLGSTSTEEFVEDYMVQRTAERTQVSALDEMEQLAAQNRNRGVRQKAVREYIAELKLEADALVAEADAARQIAEEKKVEVEALVDEAEAIKRYLEKQKAKFIAQQDALEKQQDAVRAQVKELMRKQIEAQQTKGKQGSVGTGFLNYPVAAPVVVTSSYGMRLHPVYKYERMHRGTDFRAYCGTAIYASAAGKVEWATWKSGFGNQVMLSHANVNNNAVWTSYSHLTSFAVSAGQSVTQGQVIGYSGNTGVGTGCHLHLEVYINGSDVDPMSIL